jgi:hypothetical protein
MDSHKRFKGVPGFPGCHVLRPTMCADWLIEFQRHALLRSAMYRTYMCCSQGSSQGTWLLVRRHAKREQPITP